MIGITLVEVLDGIKGDSSRFANNPIERPRELRAYRIRHKPLSSTFKNAKMRAAWPLSLMEPNQSSEPTPTTAPGLTFVCLKPYHEHQVRPISLWTPIV